MKCKVLVVLSALIASNFAIGAVMPESYSEITEYKDVAKPDVYALDGYTGAAQLARIKLPLVPLPEYRWMGVDANRFGATLYYDNSPAGESPEYRRHSEIDEFVASFAGNPLALAAFVCNEIEVVDFNRFNGAFVGVPGSTDIMEVGGDDALSPTNWRIEKDGSGGHLIVDIEGKVPRRVKFSDARNEINDSNDYWLVRINKQGERFWRPRGDRFAQELFSAATSTGEGNAAIITQRVPIKGRDLITRNAHATFMERKGSPREQCILLVYMLRRLGYSAAIVEPHNQYTFMLNAELIESLGGRSLRAFADSEGRFPVQLPYVCFWRDAGGNALQPYPIFPWLKDAHLHEGVPVSKLGVIGLQVDNVRTWFAKYLKRDASVLKYIGGDRDDSPIPLYSRYLEDKLSTKGLSLNDVGIYRLQRKRQVNDWRDLPVPNALVVNGQAADAVLNYPTSSLSARVPADNRNKMFQLVRVAVVQGATEWDDPDWGDKYGKSIISFPSAHAKCIASGDNKVLDSLGFYDRTSTLPWCELYGRTFYVVTEYDQSGKITLMLRLSPYDEKLNSGYPYNTYSGHAGYDAGSVVGDFNDGSVEIEKAHAFTMVNLDQNSKYEIVLSTITDGAGWEVASTNRPLTLGGFTSIKLAFGGSSKEAIRSSAERYWRMQEFERKYGSDFKERCKYEPIAAICDLTALSYYSKCYDYSDLCSDLFGFNDRFFILGTTRMDPTKDVKSLKGNIKRLGLPVVDMPFIMIPNGNNSVNPSQRARDSVDAIFLRNATLSALEHVVINQIYNITNSISTIKLLQLSNADWKIYDENSAIPQSGSDSYENKFLTSIRNVFNWVDEDYSVAPKSETLKYAYYTRTNVRAESTYDLNLEQNVNGAYEGRGLLYCTNVNGGGLIISTNIYNGGYSGTNLNSFYNTGSYWGSTQSNYLTYSNFGYSLNPMSSSSFAYTSLTSSISPASWSSYSTSLSSYSGVGSLYCNPFERSSVAFTSYGYSSNYTSGGSVSWTNLFDNTTAFGFNDLYTSYFGNAQTSVSIVADPVDIVTGAFYHDTADLTIDGKMALELRRNYSSQSITQGAFGYGWKLSFGTRLAINETESLIYYAHLDGSVLAYTRVSGRDEWIPLAKDNPTLVNCDGTDLSSNKNPFNNRLTRAYVDGKTYYYLVESTGRLYIFETKDLDGSGATFKATPYLMSAHDLLGNRLEFRYEEDLLRSDCGALKQVRSTNGNFMQFVYDSNSRISEVYASDGRFVRYKYDINGDLESVTRPDGSVESYEYLMHDEDGVATIDKNLKPPYSTHLLTHLKKPDGRLLINEYDSGYKVGYYSETDPLIYLRRVVSQKETSGVDLKPITTVKYQYLKGVKRWSPSGNSSDELDCNVVLMTDLTRDVPYVTAYILEPSVYGSATENKLRGNGVSSRRVLAIADPMVAKGTNHYEFDRNTTGIVVYNWFSDTSTATGGAYPLSVHSIHRKDGQSTYYKYDVRGNVAEILDSAANYDGLADGEDQRITKYFYTYPSVAYMSNINIRANISLLVKKYLPALDANDVNPVEFYAYPDAQAWMACSLYDDQMQRTLYAILPDRSYRYYEEKTPGVEDNASLASELHRHSETFVDTDYVKSSAGSLGFTDGLLLSKKTYSVTTAQGGRIETLVERSAYNWDYRGNLESSKDFALLASSGATPNVLENKYAYSSRGHLVKSIDPSGRATVFQRDAQGREISKLEYGVGNAPVFKHYTHYNDNGEVVWLDGAKTAPEDYVFFDYDGAGRVITMVRWKIESDSAGRLSNPTSTTGGFSAQSITRYEYDSFGNLVAIIDPLGNETNYQYDAVGRRTITSYPATKGSSGVLQQRPVESWDYKDYLSERKIAHTDTSGIVTDYFYTNDDKLYKSYCANTGRTSYSEFYPDGRLRRDYVYKDLSDNRKSVYSDYTYDDRLSLYTVTKMGQGAVVGKVITSYDYGQRPLLVKQYSDLISYSEVSNVYDGLGRLTQQLYPEESTGAGSYQRAIRYIYAYNPQDGTSSESTIVLNLKNLTDPATLTVKSYDPFKRLLSNEVKSAQGSVETLISRTIYAYDPLGHFVGTASGLGSGDLVLNRTSYDNAGNALCEAVLSPSVALSATQLSDALLGKTANCNAEILARYAYDHNGNRIASYDADNRLTQSTYNARNMAETITLPDGSKTEFYYSLSNQLIVRKMPGGLMWSAAYRIADHGGISDETLEKNGETIRFVDYDYKGNVGLHASKLNGFYLRKSQSSSIEKSVVYQYDVLGRISMATHSASDPVVSVQLDFAYDFLGRTKMLTSQSPSGVGLPLVKTTRDYDKYGLLREEDNSITQAGTGGYNSQSAQCVSHLVQEHDFRGFRASLERGNKVGPVGYNAPSTPAAFKYSYNANGQLDSVNDWCGNSTKIGYSSSGYINWREVSRAGEALYRTQLKNPSPSTALSADYGRDSRGQIQQQDVKISCSSVQNAQAVSERLSWLNDGRLDSVATVRSFTGNSSQWGSFTSSYNYDYSDRGQLTQETYSNVPNMGSEILKYGYDASKLGTLVSVYAGSNRRWGSANGEIDSSARISAEEQYLPYGSSRELVFKGYALGAKQVRLKLYEGGSVSSQNLKFEAAVSVQDQSRGSWTCPISLQTPNAANVFTLEAIIESTVHPGAVDRIGTRETSTFTVAGSRNRSSTTSYNSLGYLTSKTWTDGATSGEARQDFVWDALGRLLNVRQSDTRVNKGEQFLWTATYDALGRRLETSFQRLGSSGQAIGRSAVLRSWYDPDVEFLEIAVETARERYWKMYGPDLESSYGGRQGVGGLHAFLAEHSQTFYPVVTGLQGHVLAVLRPSIHGQSSRSTDYNLEWITTPYNSYGPSTLEAQDLESNGDPLRAYAWQGRRIDPTGYYYFGARYYDPLGGRFLSPDPMGHTGSADLYSYADGDPINKIDPDGRFNRSTYDRQVAAALRPQFSVDLGRGSVAQQFSGLGYDLYDSIGRGIGAHRTPGEQFAWRQGYREMENQVGQAADRAQIGLSALGMVPAFGEPVDLLNGTISAFRGDYASASLDFGSAVPLWGNGLAIGQLARRSDSIIDAAQEANALRRGLQEGGGMAVESVAKDIKVIGRLPDTAVAKPWAGHDVLDIPDWTPTKNAQWVDQGIKNGQVFYTATPEAGNLIQTSGRFAGQPTIYAHEIQQLKAAGYVKVGDYYVPASQAATFKP